MLGPQSTPCQRRRLEALIKKGRPDLWHNTDPPRILEPGKWGSKVRGLAHVQGYRGPQGYAFWNLQVPVPNLSTASRLGRFRCQICQHLQGFLNVLFFVLLWPQSLNWAAIRDVGINDSRGKRRDAGAVCRKPAAADAQCTRSRATCSDVRAWHPHVALV